MNASLISLPFGHSGSLSMNLENGKAVVELMNVMTGNPTGFARKTAHRLGCDCEMTSRPGSLAADYRLVFQQAPASEDAKSWTRALLTDVSETLAIIDRFSL